MFFPLEKKQTNKKKRDKKMLLFQEVKLRTQAFILQNIQAHLQLLLFTYNWFCSDAVSAHIKQCLFPIATF